MVVGGDNYLNHQVTEFFATFTGRVGPRQPQVSLDRTDTR